MLQRHFTPVKRWQKERRRRKNEGETSTLAAHVAWGPRTSCGADLHGSLTLTNGALGGQGRCCVLLLRSCSVFWEMSASQSFLVTKCNKKTNGNSIFGILAHFSKSVLQTLFSSQTYCSHGSSIDLYNQYFERCEMSFFFLRTGAFVHNTELQYTPCTTLTIPIVKQ